VIVIGAGAPLTLKTIQPPSSTATGAITISFFRLSPMPTPTPVVLDAFNAPVTNRIVHSNMTTITSIVYLLQVAGSGKLGGNNLGLGDADWMDWAANGDGKVDIGDGNVDCGPGRGRVQHRRVASAALGGPMAARPHLLHAVRRCREHNRLHVLRHRLWRQFGHQHVQTRTKARATSTFEL
jgi:hypothetical protein